MEGQASKLPLAFAMALALQSVGSSAHLVPAKPGTKRPVVEELRSLMQTLQDARPIQNSSNQQAQYFPNWPNYFNNFGNCFNGQWRNC